MAPSKAFEYLVLLLPNLPGIANAIALNFGKTKLLIGKIFSSGTSLYLHPDLKSREGLVGHPKIKNPCMY